MLKKVFYIWKWFVYIIKYRKKIQFDKIPKCERSAKIIIKSGKLCAKKGLHIREGTYIAVVQNGNVFIGENVFMNRNCSLVCQETITIGDYCAFGPNVVIYDHDHRFDSRGIIEGYTRAPVIIEKNCWIGAGSIILKGTHIGEGSVIGAGTVVKGKIPAHSIVTDVNRRQLSIIPIEDK